MATTDIRVDILFKKAYGLADAFPNQPLSFESVSNKPAVFPNQIYAQTIPTSAPSDLTQSTFNPANGTISGKTTTKHVSTSYPYIAKYTFLQLIDATGGSQSKVSYYYSQTQSNNLLQYSIPTKFDPILTSYAITVYNNTGVVVAADDPTNPWVLDNDSGVLTFISTVAGYKFTTGPPSITFWRYEGALGILTAPTNFYTGTTQSTSAGSGTIVLSGTNAGLGVAGNIYAGGNINVGGTIYAASFNNGGTLTLPTASGTLATQTYVSTQISAATPTGVAFLSSGSTTFTGTTPSTTTTTGTIILNGANAGIGLAGNIYAGGTINATTFNATSDYRIKDNVLPLTNSFIVDNLRPVQYYNKLSKGEDIGLIAHELQEHYPNLVTGIKDGEGYQSVNYTGLIPILIHEIKTMKKELKQLRTELDEIKK